MPVDHGYPVDVDILEIAGRDVPDGLGLQGSPVAVVADARGLYRVERHLDVGFGVRAIVLWSLVVRND